jgi:hypothetical protein
MFVTTLDEVITINDWVGYEHTILIANNESTDLEKQ